jgi:hypothetical protein
LVSPELTSQAEIMPSKILSAAFEISDAIWSIEEVISENSDFLDCLFDDDSNSSPEVNAQLILEVFDSNLLKNEQEASGYVISSAVLVPLPLSSETWIEPADIQRVLEILCEDHTRDLEYPTNVNHE